MPEFDPFDPQCLRDALFRFQQAKPDFQLLVDYLTKSRLPAIARRLGLYPVITGRVKSLESFAEKIQRPGKHFRYDPVKEATDLAGVRVIVHLLGEVEAFAREVRREFLIDEANSGDKGAQLRVQEFGYLSTHLIIQLRQPPTAEELVPPAREITPEQLNRISLLKCELQIRTICQHAWADVYHELGYKNEFQLPRRWRREFAKAAALLEVCDRQFMEIRDSLSAYESSYGAYMDKEGLERLAGRLRVLLEIEPENIRVVHRLLRTYLALGEWAALGNLVNRYDQALRRHPPALRDLGEALIQMHKKTPESEEYQRGQELLEEAVRLSPRDVDAWCSLGGSYRRQEQWGKALDCYRQGFTLEPDNPYALGQYLACELVHGSGERALLSAGPALDRAAERCHRQLEVRVNLPWAAFDLGLFSLYQGDLNRSVRFNALGIHRAQQKWMVESARNPITSFLKAGVKLGGLEVIDELLRCGVQAKGGKAWESAEAGAPDFRPPVLILAGGCAGMSADDPRLAVLKQALREFSGTLVSGGTLSGIAKLAGDLQEELGDKLVTIGYVPQAAPEGLEKILDRRYSLHRRSPGAEFSVREPLLFWRDYLSRGGDPAQVALLGFNGGQIAACEFRIALAFGARVGIIEGSGREADAFLQDQLWREPGTEEGATVLHERVRALAPQVEAIRAFLASQA